MKIKIVAIRFKDINWTGGTFRKYEVKTDKTGDVVLESRFGKKNEKIKAGDVVEGYFEDTFYIGKNGRVDVKVLKPITPEYVLGLLLKAVPGIENTQTGNPTTNVEPGFDSQPANDGFDTPAEPANDNIGW